MHRLAKKYIWWQPPDSAVQNPFRVLAGTMNLGSLEDYHTILLTFGKSVLAEVLGCAAPGWLNPKSWTFWHHVLDLIEVTEPAPPVPQRNFL